MRQTMSSLAVVGLCVAAGCTGTGAATSGSISAVCEALSAQSLAPSTHWQGTVFTVVMENKSLPEILGNPDAPYMNKLIGENALAAGYTDNFVHPSEPNYIWMVSGQNFGILDDDAPGAHHIDSQSHIADQLEMQGLSWKGYMESMGAPCGTSSNYPYEPKHNPFVYFDDITGDRARCARIVPMTELPADERSGLPQFVWITPDLCHDTHDCPGRTGDDFLSQLLPPLIAALGPGGVVLVTYDEGTTRSGCCSYAHGGRVFTIAAGPGVRSGRYAQRFDHYSLLRTIEERFGLGYLARAGSASTKSMSPMLR